MPVRGLVGTFFPRLLALTIMQLVLDIGLAPEPSFARFLPAGNEAAVQCLQQGVAALAAAQSDALLPVYLWGSPGTGKTHLLHAVARALQAQGQAVGWLGADAASGGKEFSPHWRAVLLDDVQAYDSQRQQRAFNWWINARHRSSGEAPCWVVAAGSLPPVDLPLREDLRTRLGSGLSFELQPLSDAQRQQVLQSQAQERGLHLSDEAAQYLLNRFARDLSSLSALLTRLDVHALRTQRALTIPLLREVLQEQAER